MIIDRIPSSKLIARWSIRKNEIPLIQFIFWRGLDLWDGYHRIKLMDGSVFLSQKDTLNKRKNDGMGKQEQNSSNSVHLLERERERIGSMGWLLSDEN